LRSHQPHLSANVIDVVEPVQLRLVVCRISRQACDSFFDGLTETRTDLKAFLGGAIRSHCGLLGAGLPEAAKFFSPKPQVSSIAADHTESHLLAPDYEYAHFR
jgi:hypothetical protein